MEEKAKKSIFLVLVALVAVPLFAQDIHTAIQTGDIERVKKLLDDNPQLINEKDELGRTPLHWAARTTPTNLNLLKLLIVRGANVNAADINGITPLHSAASRAQKDAVALLVDKGSELNAVDDTASTPLKYAATQVPFGYPVSQDRKDVVKLLVEVGAEVPETGLESQRLLHAAASCGYKELAEKMIALNVDLTTKNRDDGTLLHSAAVGGLLNIIDSLIKNGFDPNRRNRYGLTPLHIAAMKGHKEVVKQLLAKGANINARCPVGKTPLHYAVEGGYPEVADILVAKGTDQNPPRFPVLKGSYLGQKKPGLKPELFAAGIISSIFVDHSAAVFTPDGTEVYWSPMIIHKGSGSNYDILFMRLENGRWTAPRLISSSSPFSGCMPTISPDGKRIYFSLYPLQDDIWVAERRDKGWSEPVPVGSPPNTGNENTQPSVDSDGTLFFASFREGGYGNGDIYYSRLVNGKYAEPVNLGDAINTENMEYSPFAAPDGSYIIFCSSGRPDGCGRMDLYVSFREQDGSWGKARNMGEMINTPEDEWQPAITPDGKYLFFGSDHNGNYDIYWVDAKIIDELRPRSMKQGLG